LIKPELSAQGGGGYAAGAPVGAPAPLVPPPPTPVPADPLPANFDDVHRQLLTDSRLQFEFSQMQAPEPQERPSWLDDFAHWFEAAAPFLEYVFWAGVGVIVLLVLYVIVSEIIRRWPQRSRKQKVEAPAAVAKPEYRPANVRAQALLEEADRLAAEGRYGEAARVLLHRSIEDIERAFSLAIGPGLTSREIGALEPLSTQGRSVFSGIARAVETSLFGGRPLSADDYGRCRESYAAFALQSGRR
jgi:hypothetical protein